MSTVEFKLACENRPGTLSRLIREVKQFGLQYNKHQIKQQQDSYVIHLTASGEPNASHLHIRQKLEDCGEFKEVIDIAFDQPIPQMPQQHDQTQRRRTRRLPIRSHDHLSPSILTTAEKRLSRFIGPVASYLVEDAAVHSTTVGELFTTLASQIHTQHERKDFLSILKE